MFVSCKYCTSGIGEPKLVTLIREKRLVAADTELSCSIDDGGVADAPPLLLAPHFGPVRPPEEEAAEKLVAMDTELSRSEDVGGVAEAPPPLLVPHVETVRPPEAAAPEKAGDQLWLLPLLLLGAGRLPETRRGVPGCRPCARLSLPLLVSGLGWAAGVVSKVMTSSK